MSDLIPYQTFASRQKAKQFVKFLKKMEIVYELEEYRKNIHPSFLNNASSMEKEVLVKLRQEDFEKANEFVLQEEDISGLDANYYLNNFTNEELIEILIKPHEWSAFDRTLAPKLLLERGYNINKLDIKGRKEQFLTQLAQPKKSSSEMLIAGYLFALLGGFAGLVIGLILLSKKTLSNGERVYAYTEKSRKQGYIITLLAVVMFTIGFVVWLLNYT